MTIILLILPVLQIALYILMDLRFHAFYKWFVLVMMITLEFIFANISWTQSTAGHSEVCGVAKPILMSLAFIIPISIHISYVILKVLKDTFT